MTDFKPEEKAEIILWDWLKTKGNFVEEIYFNRINKLNAPLFRIEGTRKIPDLIIKINDGFGIKFYAIEVKSSQNSKNILKATKIIDKYFKNYILNKTEYFIGNTKINLEGFLIASDKSPKGYLFKKETFIDNTIKENGGSKYNAAVKYSIIPKKEGNRSFEFIRQLWEEYGKIRDDFERKLDCGILIGNSKDNLSPHIFITNFYYKKNRWTQRWWKI